MKPVQITINRHNVVLAIENNVAYGDQYQPAKIKVGDKLKNDLLGILMMNPHRFEIIRDENCANCGDPIGDGERNCCVTCNENGF